MLFFKGTSIMIGDIFERMGINLFGKALTVSSQRQRVIAGNIANVMTPGYVKKEVDFEDNLRRAMGKKGVDGFVTDNRHIPIGNKSSGSQPVMVTSDTQSAGVDLEKEMGASAENQLLYTTVAQLVSGKFRSLRMVIRGRG